MENISLFIPGFKSYRDLYLKDRVKQYERDRRSKTDPINTFVRRGDLPLPVEMDRFWASSDNKIRFQQFFITWAIENYGSGKPLFLGGSNVDDLTTCLKLHNGIVQSLRLSKCNHEEADDRIMYHVNHTVAIDNFTRMIVASANTDVLVCLVYHFSRWKQFNLKELWVLGSQGATRRAVPVHNLVAAMDPRVVDVLPAVHSLSGCDTTSKVSTKKSALKVASLRSDLLEGFGQGPLTENMISSAEKFLVGCISDLDKVETFDELRHYQYHKKSFEFSLEKLAATSKSIHLHIKRAYFQCYRWSHVAFIENVTLDPIDYGYVADDEGLIAPRIADCETTPDDFPLPCNCLKCAKSSVCPCRIKTLNVVTSVDVEHL